MRFSSNFAFWVACLIFIVGSVLLLKESSSIGGVFFFLPFSLGPLFVSAILSLYSGSRSSRVISTLGSVLYGIWFGYIYMSAFHWYSDPQSTIALVFVGIYSLPVMIPVWLIALAFGVSPRKP